MRPLTDSGGRGEIAGHDARETLMNRSRALVCPHCLATCSTTIPGYSRCISCGWQGPITSTPEHSMKHHLGVSNVRFSASDDADRANGLIGFVEFTLNDGIRVSGVTVRRTVGGRFTLSFPAPRQRPLLVPVDDEAREAIERQVFTALGLYGHATR